MKILYISDSLGTPIHPRGIFNYSMSLVEILKQTGASVDLLVEGSANYSIEGKLGRLSKDAPAAANTARLAEIHRYFNEAKLSFRWSWGHRSAYLNYFLTRSSRFVSAWMTFRERMNYRPNISVSNDLQAIDFIPAKSQHLKIFDGFVVKLNFYSSSMSRANLGLPPPWIDASEYDLAIVDTPHYISITGMTPERVLTIIHDLIPLRDPMMEVSWRALFLRKLEATLALNANLVFVSNYTREIFHSGFPDHRAPNEFVLSPAIRQGLTTNSVQAKSDTRQRVQLKNLFPSASDSRDAETVKADRRLARRLVPAGFDPNLPFFVTATSDEPRKNIAIVVEAFADHLNGRANMVILGEVEAARYDARESPNVYFAGYVSDDRKFEYFEASHGIIFASLSEGFGIPIVEGAVMAKPVLCSKIPVFHEVAQDGALYFEPHNALSLARCVDEVLSDGSSAKQRGVFLQKSVLARYSQAAIGAKVKSVFAKLGIN